MADPETSPVVNMDHLEHVNAYPQPTLAEEQAPLEDRPHPHDPHLQQHQQQQMQDTVSLEDHTTIRPPVDEPSDPLSPEMETDIGPVSIRGGAVPGAEPERLIDEEDLDTTSAKPVRMKPKMASLRLQTRGGRMRADQVD